MLYVVQLEEMYSFLLMTIQGRYMHMHVSQDTLETDSGGFSASVHLHLLKTCKVPEL